MTTDFLICELSGEESRPLASYETLPAAKQSARQYMRHDRWIGIVQGGKLLMKSKTADGERVKWEPTP